MLIYPRHMPEVDAQIWAALQKLSPASFGHYLENGVIGGGIRALTGDLRLLGRAVTLRVPHPDGLPVHVALDHLTPGDVLVIDRCGDAGPASLGEMTARMALAKKVAGFVIDGSVTDIRELREIGLPVYARGLSVATNKMLNAGGAELFGSVIIGGTVVRTGDIMLGDENGVVAINPDLPNLKELVERCVADENREVDWRIRLAAGESLSAMSGARDLLKVVHFK